MHNHLWLISQLSGFVTIYKLMTLLEKLIHTVSNSMRQMFGEHEDEHPECIWQYVQENCFDSDFSIYSTARHFAL